MARKRKYQEREIVPVECIVWHDARGQDREGKLRTEPMVLRTTGMVIDESDSEVTLAYEIEAIEEYLTGEAIHAAKVTSIPLVNIVERTRFGEVPTLLTPEQWAEYLKRVREVMALLNGKRVEVAGVIEAAKTHSLEHKA